MAELFATHSGQSDRQVLQRVAYDAFPGAEALYLRRAEAANAPAVFSTDTYINLFHQNRWRHLTGLSDFALEVSGPAEGLIRLFRAVGVHEAPVLCGEARLDSRHPPVCLPLAPEADFFFFEWLPDDGAGPLPTAEYTAERSPRPLGDPKAALVITTFAREADIRRTVVTYTRARQEFSEIRELTRLYVVNNQPDDAEKLADIQAEGVTLINNPRNTGGAGGFSRGAKEAVAAGWATHTLFMDDDIVIHPEAWLRTLSLVRNLKPLYLDQVVTGGMFTKEHPAYCHTLAEAKDQRAINQNMAGDQDLTDFLMVRQLLGQVDPDSGFPEAKAIPPQALLRPFSAWWYCLIPVDNFKKFGFPLPVFFRGDDQEFSLRIGRKVLSLNGICVWHPDFKGQKKRKNNLRAYLGSRNGALCTTLHFSKWRKILVWRLIRSLNLALAANDYETAAIHLGAFSDFLDFHQRQGDGPEIAARIESFRAAFPNVVKSADEAGSLETWPAAVPADRFWALLPVILTLGGGLLPSCVFRPKPIQAPLTSIKGKFPARYVAQPFDPSINAFNRPLALRLALKGFYQAAVFLISGHRARKKLQAFLASPLIQKGEWK